MKKIVTAVLAFITMATLALPAQAGEYLGIYTSTGPTPINGRFSITTSNTLNANGGFDITAISGLIDGVALTGLVSTAGRPPAPNPPYPGAVISASGNFYYDNILFPGTMPYLSGPGFLVNAANGLEYNLFSDSATAYELLFGNPAGGGVGGSTGTFSLTAVPEPATWAMIILGFGLLGGALRRRQQGVRVRYA